MATCENDSDSSKNEYDSDNECYIKCDLSENKESSEENKGVRDDLKEVVDGCEDVENEVGALEKLPPEVFAEIFKVRETE